LGNGLRLGYRRLQRSGLRGRRAGSAALANQFANRFDKGPRLKGFGKVCIRAHAASLCFIEWFERSYQ
jgi:hypothetical protein